MLKSEPSIYRTLLKITLVGSSGIILLCFAWYSAWGEGNQKGDYWTAYILDKQCIQTKNPQSWSCYRAEIHWSNSLALADWGMKCGLIGTIATVDLALSKRDSWSKYLWWVIHEIYSSNYCRYCSQRVWIRVCGVAQKWFTSRQPIS